MRIIVAVILFGLASCQDISPSLELNSVDLTPEQVDSVLAEFKFKYESPITIDSTNHILIPISTALLAKRTAFSKDGYRSGEHPRYWNVLFYDRATSETRLLSEAKIRISQIYATHSEYEGNNRTLDGKVLYRIGDIDLNGDGKLDSKDPEHLFSSEVDGQHLQRVSPQGEALQSFEVIAPSQQIIMSTLRDTNEDLAFGNEDELIWYKAALTDSTWQIDEIVTPALRKKIRDLYFKQWLKEKPE